MSSLTLLKTTLGIINNNPVVTSRLIFEAQRQGIKVGVYSSHSDREIRDADFIISGSLSDKAKLKEFATRCTLVIYPGVNGITPHLIGYLNQFTRVPQGASVLDPVKDLSIQHVLLDALHVKALPYSTVFSVSDVHQTASKLHFPLILKPVQTNSLSNHEIILTNPTQIDRLTSVLNGTSYLLEALPQHARYFTLTTFKAPDGSTANLPIVEEHYHDQDLDYANLGVQLPVAVTDQIKRAVSIINERFKYVGGLTISLILTSDRQVYVDGISLPFNFVNNVFNLTVDNVYQMILKDLLVGAVNSTSPNRIWAVKVINKHNLTQSRKLWVRNATIDFDLTSSMMTSRYLGDALLSAKDLKTVEDNLKKSRL